MAPRTLVWMADASLTSTTSNTLWGASPGGGSVTFARQASPGPGLRFSDKAACWNNGSALKNFTANATALVAVAGAISLGTATTQWQMAFFGDSGATQHITVMFDGSGHLQVRRGTSSGTVLATGTTVIPAETWFHVQVEVTINDSTGTVKVRLNGATSLEIDFTGDTKNAGTATTIDRWSITTSTAYLVDDVAIFTGTGDWPGDCRVYCLLPSGNGTTSQGVGSDGNSTDNYLLVDERPDNTSDYVAITTDDNLDLVTLADLPAGVTAIQGVQTVVVAAKSDAGSKGVKIVRRSGATNFVEASSHALSTSYQGWSVIDQNDPATTLAWTASNVNALEIGFQAAAS
jgi:hypothetical protein